MIYCYLVQVPLGLLWTFVIGVLAVLGTLVDRSGRLSRELGRIWGRRVLGILGIEVSVSGEENVPDGAAVYAANHASAIDILLLYGYLPPHFVIIHKRSLYFFPIIGQYLFLAGHIGIDRRNAFQARKCLSAAVARLRAGANIAVFPEGTRNPGTGIRHFKRGSLALALEAGVPVVPVSFVGVRERVPHGLPHTVPGRVQVIIHPPVSTAGRTVDDAAALADEVRRIVARGCGEPE